MYLSQGVDYLGFLNAKLRDLEGWSTLANELIQNADDASGASHIILDLTDAALVVSNDAQFTDCGSVQQLRCTWDIAGDGRRCCDFHAFRRVASGHKRQEEGTTGAFGIGFISVYQITDRPNFRSGQWHWNMNPAAPEEQRIRSQELKEGFVGTRFEFPWAQEASEIRARLGREPVPLNVTSLMEIELREALVRAAPFLKRLTLLELRRNGKTVFQVQCDRDSNSDEILVDVNGQSQIWKRLSAKFDQTAADLRAKFGTRIESKRKSTVVVAVPLEDSPEHGLLYAALPTEHQVELPVLINADFFPSTDRKRILFDTDYQGAWNRAAIEASAAAFSASLPLLHKCLNAKAFWHLLSRAKALEESAASGSNDSTFAEFWRLSKHALQTGVYITNSRGSHYKPLDTRISPASPEAGACLPFFESVGLNIVHADLRSYRNLLQEIGVLDLDLGALTVAVQASGLNELRKMGQVPEWLQSSSNRVTLAQAIDALVNGRMAKDKLLEAKGRLLESSLWLTVGGALAPATWLWRADESTRSLFFELDPDDIWAAEQNPAELLHFVDLFQLKDAVELIGRSSAKELEALEATKSGWVTDVIAWIDERHAQIAKDPTLKSAIRALPIWPSGGSLRKLDGLSVSGNFEDPLKLAKLVDPAIGTHFQSLLLNHLGASVLDLKTYLMEQVPLAFAGVPGLSVNTKRALLQLLSRHIGEIREDIQVKSKLQALPLVECEDGEFRKASVVYVKTAELRGIFGPEPSRYLSTTLSISNGNMEVCRWLGVNDLPRSVDLFLCIDDVLQSQSGNRREHVSQIFEGLVELWPRLLGQSFELRDLKTKAWLPSTKSSNWLPPHKLHTTFRDYLFSTQAEFLDVARPIQSKAQNKPSSNGESFIDFLGIRGEPTCNQVVAHLLHEARAGEIVKTEVFAFLEQNHEEPIIRTLRSAKCLPIEGVGYVDPGKAFRNAHRFGRFRHRLGPDWSRFSKLLEVIGVHEEPNGLDAVAVLKEMATDYADRRRLSDEDFDVNLHCWRLLANAGSDQAGVVLDDLAKLAVIPSANHFLRRPDDVYFEDRPGLASKFDDAVQNHTIRKPEGAWGAMVAVGVRELSSVVETRIVECEDPRVSPLWTDVLNDRWVLVRRVMATVQELTPDSCPTSPPEVWETAKLAVCYALHERVTPAEEVAAVFDSKSARLYVVPERKGVIGSLARELAFMLLPEVGGGPLAATLKEILSADGLEDAGVALNDLGFSDVNLKDGRVPDDAPEVGLDTDGEPAETPADNGEVGVVGAEGDETRPTQDSDGRSGGDGTSASGGTGERSNQNDQQNEGNEHHTGAGKRKSGTDASDTKKARSEKLVLRSYVQPAKDAGEPAQDGSGSEHQLDVDRRGTEHVLAWERSQGRSPKKMDHFNEGYDIESYRGDGSLDRYIEVKSLSAPWSKSSVGISAPQYLMARRRRKRFWLYIVEDLDSGEPKIHMIRDPAALVGDYRFDDGWRHAAESQKAPAKRSILTAVGPRRTDSPAGAGADARESD